MSMISSWRCASLKNVPKRNAGWQKDVANKVCQDCVIAVPCLPDELKAKAEGETTCQECICCGQLIDGKRWPSLTQPVKSVLRYAKQSLKYARGVTQHLEKGHGGQLPKQPDAIDDCSSSRKRKWQDAGEDGNGKMLSVTHQKADSQDSNKNVLRAQQALASARCRKSKTLFYRSFHIRRSSNYAHTSNHGSLICQPEKELKCQCKEELTQTL